MMTDGVKRQPNGHEVVTENKSEVYRKIVDEVRQWTMDGGE